MVTEKKVRINLIGVNGNAFAIIGAWSKEARHQGWSKDEINKVVAEATSGDYTHLLATFLDHSVDPEEAL